MNSGILAITHPQLVNNFPITSAFTSSDVQVTTLTDENDLKDLYLTGYTSGSNDINVSSVEYEDINTAFKQVAVCIGMPKEFYISNNSTFPRGKILSQLNEQEGIISFDPVYVTEVGMYNALGETIGIAKLSQPVEKDYTGLVVFTVEIDM